MAETPTHRELKVENPTPGPEHDDTWFALHIPTEVTDAESFKEIRWHIEFRRKCMNQGFDNLLELLNKTEENIAKDKAAKAAKREGSEHG